MEDCRLFVLLLIPLTHNRMIFCFATMTDQELVRRGSMVVSRRLFRKLESSEVTDG